MSDGVLCTLEPVGVYPTSRRERPPSAHHRSHRAQVTLFVLLSPHIPELRLHQLSSAKRSVSYTTQPHPVRNISAVLTSIFLRPSSFYGLQASQDDKQARSGSWISVVRKAHDIRLATLAFSRGRVFPVSVTVFATLAIRASG